MSLSRRAFLRTAGALGVSSAFCLSVLSVSKTDNILASPESGEKSGTQPRYGMFIDLETCIGCLSCTLACRVENNIPGDISFIVVPEIEQPRASHMDRYYRPKPCMHCAEPACVFVCPVTATYKREDGIVVQDVSRCIGCKYCMHACPYQVRYFNKKPPFTFSKPHPAGWDYPGGVVLKCTFCQHRIDAGNIMTACEQSCPVRAIYFGDISDPDTEVSRVIAERKGEQLLPRYLTEPQVYYGLPRT